MPTPQQDFNKAICLALRELAAIMQQAGYMYDDSLKEAKSDSARIARRLHKLLEDIQGLKQP